MGRVRESAGDRSRLAMRRPRISLPGRGLPSWPMSGVTLRRPWVRSTRAVYGDTERERLESGVLDRDRTGVSDRDRETDWETEFESDLDLELEKEREKERLRDGVREPE